VSSSWSYLDPVILPLIVGNSVLDAGCGVGRWGSLIESNYWEAGLESPPVVDGCDAFKPNVEHCRQRGTYGRVWEQTMPSPLDGTWDTVLACELIEHVPQERVTETLDILEAAAVSRIIVSTPNSPLYRPGHETPFGFNDWEAHVSYVPRSALVARGYRIYGAGFGRYNSRLALRAKRWHVRRSLTSLPYRIPAIAETIVAVKDVAAGPLT
jgi:2-polyprenyl-3-methyl-5-hydroxy-6-metoxy-1,4-benzoquinol methylase